MANSFYNACPTTTNFLSAFSNQGKILLEERYFSEKLDPLPGVVPK